MRSISAGVAPLLGYLEEPLDELGLSMGHGSQRKIPPLVASLLVEPATPLPHFAFSARDLRRQAIGDSIPDATLGPAQFSRNWTDQRTLRPQTRQIFRYSTTGNRTG